MSKLIVPGILTSYRPLNDKSFNLSLNIPEPTPQAREIIHQLHQQSVFLMLKESSYNTTEKEQFDSLEEDLYDKQKSQSKRLRSVLFLCWQKENKGFKDFEGYYKAETEIVITHFKKRLD